jgi:hypothetical protein
MPRFVVEGRELIEHRFVNIVEAGSEQDVWDGDYECVEEVRDEPLDVRDRTLTGVKPAD